MLCILQCSAHFVFSLFSERGGSCGLCDHCAHSAGYLPGSFCTRLHRVDLQEASTYFLPGHMGLLGCHGIPFYVFWRNRLSLGSSKKQMFSVMILWAGDWGFVLNCTYINTDPCFLEVWWLLEGKHFRFIYLKCVLTLQNIRPTTLSAGKFASQQSLNLWGFTSFPSTHNYCSPLPQVKGQMLRINFTSLSYFGMQLDFLTPISNKVKQNFWLRVLVDPSNSLCAPFWRGGSSS